MRGLHYQLKQNIAHGFVRLTELRPNSLAIAKRLLETVELYVDSMGFLRLAAE